MIVYTIRRTLQSLLVLAIIIVITFTLPYFQPNGIDSPAYAALGVRANPVTVHIWAVQHGLAAPYLTRLWQYTDALVFHLNLGHSFKQGLSVNQIIALYVPRTLWLALTALLLTTLIAIPLGIFQSSRRNTAVDYGATGSAFILYAMPSFLLCILMIDAFGFHLLHLPVEPPTGVEPWAIFTDPKGFILPVASLTLLGVAGLSRFMRGTMLEVSVQDYVRTAKAKGCSPSRVLWRHSFRNALGPIVVILGLSIPALFGGALIIEDVFNYAGLGIQTVNAALEFDVPTVMGITLLVAIFTLLGNYLADIALALLNPRIRFQGME
ncbi:MAG: ABC transporter permease [Acidimicrobiales bacterium]